MGSARGLGELGEPEPEGLWARIEPDQKWSLVVPRADWANRLRPAAARGLGAIQWSDRISVGWVGGCGDEARVVPTGFYPPMHGRDERRCRLQRAGGGLEAQQAVSGQCIGEGAAHARRRWPTPGGGGARQEAAPWTSGVSVPSVSKIVASLPCGGRVRPSVRWRAKVQLRQCVVHVAPSASEVVAPTEHGDAARTTSEVAAP